MDVCALPSQLTFVTLRFILYGPAWFVLKTGPGTGKTVQGKSGKPGTIKEQTGILLNQKQVALLRTSRSFDVSMASPF